MLVEASTIAPSLASSGFLSPRVPSSADLLVFATGGFDDDGVPIAQPCAFRPLWLTHETRYCHRGQLEALAGETSLYPATIDVFSI